MEDEEELYEKLLQCATIYKLGGEAECRIVASHYKSETNFNAEAKELVAQAHVSNEAAVRTLFKSALDGYSQEIKTEAELKGLKRDAVRRILKLPIGEQQEALDKCSPRGIRHVENIRLRIINSKEANEVFTSKLHFIHRLVLSALCCAIEEGHRSVSVSDLWKIMAQDSRWDNVGDKEEFRETVGRAVICLDSLLRELEDENEWIVEMDGDDIVLRRIPALWDNFHKIAMPQAMLGGKSHLDWLSKVYVAFCVIRSRKQAAMNEAVLWTTMERDIGRRPTVPKVRSYLSRLQDSGEICGYEIADDAFRWKFKEKENENGKEETDMARPTGRQGADD